MYRRFIFPACLQIALPDGQVHRPANFFIKQDIFSHFLNIVIGANGDLTGYAGGVARKEALLRLETGGNSAFRLTPNNVLLFAGLNSSGRG